jgi:hypothetical protein
MPKKKPHILRLSEKLWKFFKDRKEKGYGTVQGQINTILTTFKEKHDRKH